MSKQVSISEGVGALIYLILAWCYDNRMVGTVLAVIFSWAANHSVLWCIIHAIFGWVYVFYWILFK